MNIINSLVLAVALLTGLFSVSSLQADEACLKLVLSSYCLGGKPAAGLVADDAGSIVIDNPAGKITLTVKENHIVAIDRAMTPATWLEFHALKVKLVRIYSTADDISDFPSYATSRSSKLNAIRAGRGYAAARWQQSGWSVLLQWKSLEEMQLRYVLDDQFKSSEFTDTPEGL